MALRLYLQWTLLLAGEAALLVAIGSAFWLQDWQYALPTPRPASLRQPELGERLELPPAAIARLNLHANDRPVLLHFFNPACPCSRFNATHLRSLAEQFEGRVHVLAVLEADDAAMASQQFAGWQVPCESTADVQGEIARSVGVYSTPQAVILDGEGRLIYRGNYNLSRYCLSPETEFVRLALEACLRGEKLPRFPEAALIAQGCPLPADLRLRAGEAR